MGDGGVSVHAIPPDHPGPQAQRRAPTSTLFCKFVPTTRDHVYTPVSELGQTTKYNTVLLSQQLRFFVHQESFKSSTSFSQPLKVSDFVLAAGKRAQIKNIFLSASQGSLAQ